MISLTDYALFTTLKRVYGETFYDSPTPEDCVRGTFSLGDKAFRDYEKRYGKLRLPLYSLMWTSMTRDDTRYNRVRARHGQHDANLVDMLQGMKVQLYPINLEYELTLWTTRSVDLLDGIRATHFFTTDAGGNGATVDFSDIDEGLKEGTEDKVLEALQGFSFDCTVGPDVNMEKSDPSSEMGTYYKATLTLTAHTWWAKGYKIPLVRQIVANIYNDID